MAQVLSRGAGFLSCQPPELVFGLGGASEADLRVLWPGGLSENFGTVDANAKVLLVEGAGRAKTLEVGVKELLANAGSSVEPQVLGDAINA